MSKKRRSKVTSTDNLQQTSITNFFTRIKGPSTFDNKPIQRLTASRAIKMKHSISGDDDFDEIVLSGNKSAIRKKAKNANKRRKVKPIPSDDEDVVFIEEYKLPDDDRVRTSNNKENSFVEELSPKIILHTSKGDILFMSDATKSDDNGAIECSSSNQVGTTTQPAKNSSATKDNSSVSTFSHNSFVCSTPRKEMSITRSEKQSTELQKRSRILQMSYSTSNIVTATTSEYITTDFLQPNILDTDATLIRNQGNAKTEPTIVNFVTTTITNENMFCNRTLTKENCGDSLQVFGDIEYNENRRRYHLSLVDKIVKNANKEYLNNLLLNVEKHMLNEYMALPENYKFVCCKLFTYTYKWQNLYKFMGKIKLPVNTMETKELCEYLVARNIITKDVSSETSIYLLDLLEADDVKDIHKSLKLKSKRQTKPILMKSILEHSNQQTTLTSTSLDKIVREKIYQKLGLCVRLTDCFYNMFYKIHLLYSFTNPEFANPSDLYLFMARIKNGEIRMPTVLCEEKAVFKDAEEFARFSKACNFKNELLSEFDKKKKSDNMKELCRVIYTEFRKLLNERSSVRESEDNRPSYLKRFSAGYKYASALSFACKQMTTECPDEVKNWLELLLSQDLFCQLKRGFWYSQLSMVLNRYSKNHEKAAEIIVAALKDKRLSVIDLSELSYKGKGYCKKKTTNTTRSVKEELLSLLFEFPDTNDFPSIIVDSLAAHGNQAGVRSQYKVMNAFGDIEFVSVEQVAINHYINEKGFLKGIHCEGALMSTVLAVLFWDILYSPSVSSHVPFAFISELQHLPLDFSTKEFYFNRQMEIEDRLNNIKTNWSLDHLEDYIDTIWNNLSHTKSLIVPNVVADSTELNNIVLCIGRDIVSEICRRLVEHFREHRAGMPDLFLWNAATKKSKFVEVKGPGDKLSTKQKLWLQFLTSVGADIEVCHIHPVGSNRSQKYKKKPKQEKQDSK